MKWIKLFESFNSKLASKEEALKVIEDIKTIDYILEENEYRIKYLTNDNPHWSHYSLVPKFEIQLSISPPFDVCEDIRSKIYNNSITDVNKDPRIVKFYEDVNHFFIILKDHLDYVSSIELDMDPTNCVSEIIMRNYVGVKSNFCRFNIKL
jgi:hypothetical protein